MRKSLILAGMLSIGYAYAQEGRVGINTEDPKATLDIKSVTNDTAKGILIPQLTGDALKTMTSGLTANQHGLLTYATSGVTTADEATANVQFPGYHRFNIDGTTKSWVRMEPSGLEKIKGEGTNIGWRLVGNKNKSIIGNYAVDLTIYEGTNTTIGATGTYSFAAGVGATASSFGAVAIGQNVQAINNNAVAMGWNTKASGIRAFAMGNFAEARGHSSVALGYNTIAVYDRAMAFGTYNTIDDETATKKRLFVLGNGAGKPIPDASTIRSDAFTVLYSGEVGIDIDNFETTTSDAKLQVNGKILSSSLAGDGDRAVYADENGVLKVGSAVSSTSTNLKANDTGEACSDTNLGAIHFKEVEISGTNPVKKKGVFGFCTKQDGTAMWVYLSNGGGIMQGTGTFGEGL